MKPPRIMSHKPDVISRQGEYDYAHVKSVHSKLQNASIPVWLDRFCSPNRIRTELWRRLHERWRILVAAK